MQAVYGTGLESLLYRLASAALLLWTAIFWVALFSTAINLISLFWSVSTARRVNEFLCRSCFLLASGYYFNRWLEYWRPEDEKFNPTPWLLLLAVAGTYLVVRHRRIKSGGPAGGFTPTWRDCFSYLVSPILLITFIAVGGKIVLWYFGKTELKSATAEARANPSRGDAERNVIIIVSDSLRAQSMSLYGQPDNTTPSIDEFAENSTVYLDAHANASTTVPSILSILSGQHPLSHGRFNRDLPPQPDARNLLMLLREQGYTTAAVTSNGDASLASLDLGPALTEPEIMAFSFHPFSWLRRFGVHPTRFSGRMYEDLAAFMPFFAWPRRTSVNGNAADTLARATELIATLQKPFFLFIHIHEPHSPHYLPKDFKPIPIAVDRPSPLTFYAHYAPEFQPVVNAYRDAYEKIVTAVDAELGKFFEALERKPWYDKTMVIFTADHGDSFEHGYLYHGEELFENSTWIPLVIHYPGQKKGARFPGLTQSIDVVPTILNALQIPEPTWLDGHVLTPDAPPDPIETIATNLKQPANGVFYYMPTKLALWWNRYKLIASCDVGKTALYDLVNDPAEQTDATALYPDVASDLRRRLRLRLGQQTRTPPLTCPNL